MKRSKDIETKGITRKLTDVLFGIPLDPPLNGTKPMTDMGSTRIIRF